MAEWTNIQAKVYNLLPTFLRRPANNLRLLPHYLGWRFHEKGQRHAADVIGPMKDKFAGCRCIVIGNGSSLKIMDLSVLKHEFTFGLNRIYLLFEQLGFETNFFVSTNGLVLKQFAKDINKVKSLRILNWLHRKYYEVNEKTVFLCAKPSEKMDARVLNGYFAGSGTVTNLALELAFFFGFSEVILIGIDHSYAFEGQPGVPVVSNGNDFNHFSPDYFGKGTVWQLPNYKAMEFGYLKI